MAPLPANTTATPFADARPVASGYGWQVVGMLWWICFFNYADRQAIFSIFPLLARDFHLNPLQLGLLGSAFAWVYALAGLPMGLLVDRIRYKTSILCGLEVWSLICTATALSRRFTSLLLFRAAEGLGESIYFPASMSMLSAYHPGKTRSRALGLHQTSVYAGTVAGGLLAGWLGQRFGWQSSFVVFGGLGVLLGLPLTRFLREPPRTPSADGTSLAQLTAFLRCLLRSPSALLLMLAFAAMNFVAVVQLVWMPSFLYGRFHLSLAQAGFLGTAAAQSGAVLGAVFGGFLADRRRETRGGRIGVQIAGALAAAPFVYLCGAGFPLLPSLAMLGLWGFGKGVYDANIFASLFDVLPPEVRGSSTGVMNASGWLLGGTTAPVAMGFLAMHHGLGFAIQCAALGYLVAAILLAAAALRHRRIAR